MKNDPARRPVNKRSKPPGEAPTSRPESDQTLLARVAEKLGWVRRMNWDWLDHWKAPDRKRYSVIELPSTDECLALTGEPEGLELWKDGTGWNCSYPTGEKTGTFAHGEPNRPRAILKAILEVE